MSSTTFWNHDFFGLPIYSTDPSPRTNEITKSDRSSRRPRFIEKGPVEITTTGPSKLSKWRVSRRNDEQDVERKRRRVEEIQTWYANEGTRFPLFCRDVLANPVQILYVEPPLTIDPVLNFILAAVDSPGTAKTKPEICGNEPRETGDNEKAGNEYGCVLHSCNHRFRTSMQSCAIWRRKQYWVVRRENNEPLK